MTKLSNTLNTKDIEPKMPKNIILIDDCKPRQSKLKDALLAQNFTLLDTQNNTKNLVITTQMMKPDVIVIGVDEPDELILEDLLTLRKTYPVTVVIFAERNSPSIIQQSTKIGVSAYIVDGIQPHRIPNILFVAYTRFMEYQQLAMELTKAKNELANRKVIDRAKGILMQQKNISENEAFKMLRKMSMDKGKPISDIATNIIDVFDLIST